MKIAVAGGSGFIGSTLVERLVSRGDVVVLTRNASRVRHGRGVDWRPPLVDAWAGEVAEADVVINLAGENIGGGRWSAGRKRDLVSSRLASTRALVEAMKQTPAKQRTFISASAIGFYGLHGDETLTEESPKGAGFLADLCEQWEAAAREAERISRFVILRFGIVLDERGGALAKMLLPFKLGAGGPIGSGRQWMSWVDLVDVIRAVEWTIENGGARGVYNVTALEPVRNGDFARALGRALHRPAFMPAPGFALRIMFGDMADEALLGGQRVLPSRLEAEGFAFAQRTLADSLRRIFGDG